MRQNCLFVTFILSLAFFTEALNLRRKDEFVGEERRNLAQPRVIVVGAGVAGLAAASKLHQSGKFNVTLFEAADRIGGRIHSLKLGDQRHIELGAEWVHGEHGNSVYDLVSPLRLLRNTHEDYEIQPLEFGDYFGFPGGERLNSTMGSAMHELLDHIWRDPYDWGAEYPDDLSMGAWSRMILEEFRTRFPIQPDETFWESVLDWAHRITNAEDASDNWFETSSNTEGEQYKEIEGFANIPWKPPYSFSSLLELILTGNVTEEGRFELPTWIELNKEVTTIRYSTDQETAEVCTSDDICYVVDHVIFTPSLGVLKAYHLKIFQPPLSERKQLAIDSIGFGSSTKYYLEFETPWWPNGYEGTFLLWNDHDYSNKSLDYWRQDITLEELLVEYPVGGNENNLLPLWCRSILSIFTVDSGSHPNTIRIWLTGMPSRFLDAMDPTYLQTTVMKVVHVFLDNVFPNIPGQPIRTYQSKWSSNPFVRGTYSYRTIKSEDNDVWARDIARPIMTRETSKPVVCFAGEATHPIYFSTVHGAYDSGVREFGRIQRWSELKNNQ